MTSQQKKNLTAFYYNVALFSIPGDLQLKVIAESVVPVEANQRVAMLWEKFHVRLIPHQLQIYKEALPYKFGYVTYAVNCTEEISLDKYAELHSITLSWIEEDLLGQLLVIQCKSRLAQPKELYQFELFLNAVAQCLDALKPADALKFRSFLFFKMEFLPSKEANEINQSWAKHGSLQESTPFTAGASWSQPVGSLSLNSFSAAEVLWLSKILVDSPSILLTNSDPKTAKLDFKSWLPFLSKALSPLITITK